MDSVIKKTSTPTILASNHANSFFDALIIATTYPEPVYFLARGDAFNKKWAGWLLRKMKLIPIYRLEEGKQFLGNNEQSFAECMQLFRNGGSILIFPEGLSKHELSLRPLRKGAARLAYQAWTESNIPELVVQPISLTYNSFEKVPKIVEGHYAEPITINAVTGRQEAMFYNQFNAILRERLEEKPLESNYVTKKIPLKMALLAIPSFLGYITHRWFYNFWKRFVAKKTANTVFYDSVLFSVMMLTYPILVLIVTTAIAFITGNPLWWLLTIALPFIAWSYKEYKGMYR